jgi:hypothetical protein
MPKAQAGQCCRNAEIAEIVSEQGNAAMAGEY